MPERRAELGLCQWFHFQDHAALARCVALLRELGVRHLRTGISWADFHRPGGEAWYREVLDALRPLEVLLSIWHTPPSLSEDGRCAAPPRRLQDYADFVDQVITLYGDRFAALELWNEPNNLYKWDFARHDPRWERFARMVSMAGHWARRRGKRTVLGGMIPVDPRWLALMDSHGALEHVDVVAIHGFPGMWWGDAPSWDWPTHWRGWAAKVDALRPVWGARPVWITETGLATWDLAARRPARQQAQAIRLLLAAGAPVERVYWYCLTDLDPEREAIEGFHVDENEYHLGLVTHDGVRKPAFETFRRLLDPSPEDAAFLRRAGLREPAVDR